MLITKKVIITWQRPTCTHFKNLGYKFTKIGDEFEVKVEDLEKGSHASVQCLCDYCLDEGKETILTRQYREYLKERQTIPKDCCKQCAPKKQIELNLFKYGVKHTLSLTEVRDKIKDTNLKKYGCENPFQNDIIKEKIKQTNLEKYGVENYTQTQECQDKITNTTRERYGVDRYSKSDECKEKVRITNIDRYGVEYYSQTEECTNRVKNTCIEKYGVDSYSKTEECKERSKQTSLERWGVEYPMQSPILKNKVIQSNLKNWGYCYPMQNPEFLEKQKIRVVKAMKEKGTVNYSQQQEHICKLLNGELNFLVDACFLDIALVEEHIYIEYNGSGHDIQLRIGKITEKEFKAKELRRYQFLKSQGWKEIEITSSRDYLPEDDIIKELINESKQKLHDGCNWVKIDIDNELFITKYNKVHYNLGKLHRLN